MSNRWSDYKLDCVAPSEHRIPQHPFYHTMGLFLKTQVPLPASTDLRQLMPPVYDQGKEGSCTGNGTAAAIHYGLLNSLNIKDFMPSRAFLYYNGRAFEGNAGSDSGCVISDVVDEAGKLGFCPENDRGNAEPFCPYVVGDMSKPADACFQDALKHHVGYALHVTNVAYHLQHCLGISRYPIVFGFSVPDTFMQDAMSKTGQMTLTDWQSQNVVGGHCVIIVGYDGQGNYIVRNSWGSDWGMQGYFLMPASCIEVGDGCISNDFRTIQNITFDPGVK